MGSAIFAKEIRPVVDTTLLSRAVGFFKAVREAAKVVLPKLAGG
jgi:hypothetical protein